MGRYLLIIVVGLARIAKADPIELLHATDAKVTVSSQVANASIKPSHLVDKDLGTAWNSRTNDLVGAWIEITLPPKVVAKELRLTIGHTGKGGKREDWFTMNPRIKHASVKVGDATLNSHAFDLTNRGLQVIDLEGKVGSTIRITVQDIEPGSKKSWREICVSELEVWGTAPAELVHPDKPPPVAVDHAVEIAALCDPWTAADDAYNKETSRQERHPSCPTCVDGPGDMRGRAYCETQPIAITPSGPWKAAALACHVDNSHQGDKECTFNFLTDTWWSGPSTTTRPYKTVEITSATIGKANELVITYDGQVVTCRPDATCK